MDDLARIKLLLKILMNAPIGSLATTGNLSDDIESICSLIDGASEDFYKAYRELWGALEVVGVKYVESGNVKDEKFEDDLAKMLKNFINEVNIELNSRIPTN